MIKNEELIKKVTEIVVNKVGGGVSLDVLEKIVTEVTSNLIENMPPEEKSGKEEVPFFSDQKLPPFSYCSNCKDIYAHRQQTERAIITVTGKNSVGIVAGIAQAMAEYGGDIVDISQTLVGDFFTMIMVVGLSNIDKKGYSFNQFKEHLVQAGEKMNLHLTVIHENVFQAMQRV